MAMTLAALEVAAIFAAVWGTLLWAAPGGSSPHALAGQAVTLAVCSLVAFYYTGLYDLRTVRSFGQSAQRLPRALSVAFLPAGAAHLLFSRPPTSYGALLSSLLIAIGLVLIVRASAYRLLDTRPLLERVLIVGDSWLADALVKEIQSRPDLRQRVVGLGDGSADAPAGFQRSADLSALAAAVEHARPHRVIVALAARRGQMPLQALFRLRLAGIKVEDGVELYEKHTGKIAVEVLTPSSLIFSKDYRVLRLDMTLTRLLGLPATAAALLLLAPVLALIALAIRLDSPGPVFFIQQRVGRQGRLFPLIKFRTMHPALSATSEWARDNSGRLTRVGGWLRRFRLDELPQLLNILKGDMNLVGPRPHPVSNLSLLVVVMRNTPDCGEQIPYYALRSLVRPGITGWAQVRYRYANDLEEEIEKMRYDLYYVKHMSPSLDLRILLETISIVLRGRESAPEEPGARRAAAAAPAPVVPARASLRLAAEAPPQSERGPIPSLPLGGAAVDGAPTPSPSAVPIKREPAPTIEVGRASSPPRVGKARKSVLPPSPNR
jgi:exopolysaccharide biosynthesis polyprenyl glycosylphosphotransferase